MKNTNKYGRGVYAARDIKKGERFEVSHTIMFSEEEWLKIKETSLLNYCFYWDYNPNYVVIALGYGSLFNHSYNPNAVFFNNKVDLTVDFYAITDINKDEEITINYNGDIEDKSLLWFNVI